MEDIVKALKSVRDVYVSFPKRLKLAEEELSKINQEIQDILHVLELAKFNASEGYKYARDIKELRLERRKLKDEIELLEKIQEFTAYPKASEKVINKTIGEINKVQTKFNNRFYTMRVRKDLQEMIK